MAAVRSTAKGVPGGLSWGDADDLRERAPSVEKLAIYSPRTWGVQTERQGHVEVLLSAMTTGEFFEVLGVSPALGDPMTRAHDAIGAQSEAWLANAAAARLFGHPEASLHRTLWINGAPYSVAGVLPAGFRFPMAQGTPDMIIPLSRAEYCCARGAGAQQAIALLRDSGRFDAELRVASNTLARDFPATNAGLRFVPVALREYLFGPRILALRWILAGALCLTIIAAANGSGIWMARWLRVRRDMAIRLSLGASAPRLAAVRATEGAIAGFAAGAVGLAIASAILRVAQAVPFLRDRLEAFAVWRPVSLESAAIPGALMVGVGVGLIAALLPHIAVMGRLAREGTCEGMSTHPAARRVRLVLTAVQLTATAILGWTAITIGENVHTLLTARRGFETEETLIAGIGLPEARYDTDEKMIGFHAAAIAQLQAVPGVTAAAGGVNVPQGNMRTRFLRDGQTLERDRQPMARIGVVSPELLPLLRISLRRGRGFTSDDRWSAPRAALVNEAFVRGYLADSEDPLREGLRLSFYNGFAMKPYTRFQIVGIIADTRNDGLLVDPQPQILIPAAQIAMEGFFYYVKTARPAASVQTELREAIWRVDPAIERVTFSPLNDYVEQGLAERRALSAFGLLVLLVAAVIVAAGLFASLSASLLESTRELAIRAALGATPARLAVESLRWALVAVGLAGVVTAVAVPFVASSVPLEKAILRPTPASVTLCLLTMGVVTGAAALRPAWRAASVSPADALRAQ
ncbi:MAG TPA: ABC transporter permease [Bryobacteraceae bacterium]|nr:ABC transporter permease [Bryobacteraceae bacterium]